MDLKLKTKKILQEAVQHTEIGLLAAKLRDQARASQRKMASLMGISGAYLCDLEKGRRNWTQETVDKFNKALKSL